LKNGFLREKNSGDKTNYQHATLRRKCKDWLAENEDNVSSAMTCLPADCCLSELAL
jgi:hypothetical protein